MDGWNEHASFRGPKDSFSEGRLVMRTKVVTTIETLRPIARTVLRRGDESRQSRPSVFGS